jgi:hypothetical protein
MSIPIPPEYLAFLNQDGSRSGWLNPCKSLHAVVPGYFSSHFSGDENSFVAVVEILDVLAGA